MVVTNCHLFRGRDVMVNSEVKQLYLDKGGLWNQSVNTECLAYREIQSGHLYWRPLREGELG